MRRWERAWLSIVLGAACAFAQSPPAPDAARSSGFKVVETLAVDASDAPRKVFHARMTIPATPGDFVLLYPKWIPGQHGPNGPVVDTAGIYFRVHEGGARGTVLTWHRDPQDLYAFHVDVPASVTAIEATLDYLSPVEGTGGFSGGTSSSDKLAVLSWNWVVLYPKGIAADEIGVKASLKLPSRWHWATALPRAPGWVESTPPSNAVEFGPASLTTLIDSPVLMGEYMQRIALQKGQTPPHSLDIAGDSEAALEIRPEQSKALDNLVAEAGALFGARHYREYRFLLTLSNHVTHFGLEHHECSDNRANENFLTDDTEWVLTNSLLPHEYVHSWNGKYRRPAGLATADYAAPMETDLLWVYEGLTQYLGYLLTARSGLQTPEQWRENLARVATTFSYRPGRKWRPLEDTAVTAQMLYGAAYANSNYRRAVDYYDEGALIWLEADAIIRAKSAGKRSLDDFARLFFGGRNSGPEVKSYTFEDVVNALNQVQAYDWRGFLNARVTKVAERAPLEGIANSGWKLVYNDQQNAISKLIEQVGGANNATASLGMVVSKDGSVADVIEDGIAAKNGIAPGMKILAINDRKFAPELVPQAIRDARTRHQPIRLLVENTEFIHSVSLAYYEGLRYPHLERDPSKPDMLSEIIRPKVTTPSPSLIAAE
jgi:predicted metalloprotease with PDZ domain